MKKTRLIILIVALLSIVCAICIGWKTYLDNYQETLQNFASETKVSTDRIDVMFENMIRTFDKEVLQFEAFLTVQQWSDDKITEYLRERTRLLSTSVDAMYVDLYCGYRGKYLCGNYWQPPASFDIHIRPWYIQALWV